MMPPRKHVKEDNTDSWLMSYADMITLLLCFFIVFVSVSEPRKDKLRAITEGMAQRFGVIDLITPFQGLLHSLQAVAETRHVLKDVGVEMTPNSVEMELGADAFFQKDSAELKEDKMPVLLEIAEKIKAMDYIDYRVTVEGHTSDAPVTTPAYPSNWELSSARASRIVRAFIDHGIPADRLRAIGYAGIMPKVPNLDESSKPIPENRAKNQRMVIKIERAK